MTKGTLNSPRRVYSLLFLAGLLYTILYVAFFPPIHTTMDESAYLNQAYALRAGTIYSDVAGISTVQGYSVGPKSARHEISEYPPGMGGLLAGASLASWHAALGINLLIHLSCFAVLAITLKQLRIWPGFAILYLLHPTAVIFSRTTMSDLTCGLLTLLAFALYLRGRFVLAGVLVGLGMWIRTVGGLALPLFCVGALIDAVFPLIGASEQIASWGKRLMQGCYRAALIVVGALPLIAGAWLYQKVIQENGWQKYSGEGLLGLHHFPQQFPQYALQLSFLYPLMLFAPALYRRAGRGALMSLCYGVLLFYCCYYFQDATGSKLESFIIGLRFLLMVIPLYIVAYSSVIQVALERLNLWPRYKGLLGIAGIAISLLLFVGASAIHRQHQRFLQQSAATRDIVAQVLGGTAGGDKALLLCNVHVAKLLHPGWSGAHHYIVLNGDTPFSQIEAAVNRAQGENKQVYVGFWSRESRPETPGELRLLQRIEQRYSTEQAARDLPPDVYLLQIQAPSQSLSPPPVAKPATRP